MKTGQGILLKLDYADGGLADKARTFLIISINEGKVNLLNISSIQGKLHKLMYPANKKILKYKPPFIKPSFVKLDAEYIIDNNQELESFILCQGRAMEQDELSAIIKEFDEYKSNYNVNIAYSSIDKVMKLNQNIARKQVAADKNNR